MPTDQGRSPRPAAWCGACATARRRSLLVHRPRYDDWTLPKGKLLPGETGSARPRCARSARRSAPRSRCSGASARSSTRSATRARRSTYWAMRYRGGEFAPNDEVDEVEWLRVGRALPAADLRRRPQRAARLRRRRRWPIRSIVLVRHAKAGKRSDWRGDDDLRPLDAGGRAPGRACSSIAACRSSAPNRIYAADRTRCVQTVEPLAHAMDCQRAGRAGVRRRGVRAGPGGTAESPAGAGEARQGERGLQSGH